MEPQADVVHAEADALEGAERLSVSSLRDDRDRLRVMGRAPADGGADERMCSNTMHWSRTLPRAGHSRCMTTVVAT